MFSLLALLVSIATLTNFHDLDVNSSYCNFPSFLWQQHQQQQETTNHQIKSESSDLTNKHGANKTPGKLWYSYVTLKSSKSSDGSSASDDDDLNGDLDSDYGYQSSKYSASSPPTQYYYKNLPYLSDANGMETQWSASYEDVNKNFPVDQNSETSLNSKSENIFVNGSLKYNFRNLRSLHHQQHNDFNQDDLSDPSQPLTFSTSSRFPVVPNSYREVLVETSLIRIKLLSLITCFNKSANRSNACYSKQEVQEISCLSEEINEKYRVRIKSDGESKFGCMRFIHSWPNVVQVFVAQPKKINDARLCLDPFIKRSSHPWIVSKKEVWSFCPFSGGFDFRIYLTGRRKPICGKSRSHWRPSRMESECIIGEGLAFTFQDSKCNFLPPELNGSTLTCWGSFIEGASIFVFFGGSNQSRPQYTLRLPSNPSQSKEMWATLYFSIYAPQSNIFSSTWNLEDALIESNRDEFHLDVEEAELKQVDLYLITSDGGVCYDESDFCSEFAREGRCVNSALHKFANFCKKSCGLCGHKADLVPSTNSECHFPVEYRGRWLLTETDHMEEVVVEEGRVVFSRLGTFICKSKHWKKEQYKVFSVYENGCRPRYSCIHFRQEGKILYFQISKSSLFDNSFDLCIFKDDEESLKDAVRSKKLKMLIAHNDLKYDKCDLNGSIRMGITFHSDQYGHKFDHHKTLKLDERTCNGTLSDGDASRCQQSNLLMLHVPNCPYCAADIKYKCVGSVDVNDFVKVLITKLEQSFNCWVIFAHHDRMVQRPWKLVYVIDRGQCGQLKDISVQRSPDNVAMTIETFSDPYPPSKCQSNTVPSNKQKSNRKSSRTHRVKNITIITTAPSIQSASTPDSAPNNFKNDAVYSNIGAYESVHDQYNIDYVESGCCCCCRLELLFVLLLFVVVVRGVI